MTISPYYWSAMFNHVRSSLTAPLLADHSSFIKYHCRRLG